MNNNCLCSKKQEDDEESRIKKNESRKRRIRNSDVNDEQFPETKKLKQQKHHKLTHANEMKLKNNQLMQQ